MKRIILFLAMIIIAVTSLLAGQTYALITGVSSYADPRNNTHQTTEDAQNFRKIMRNDTKNITLLTSENATVDATIDKLKKFAAGTKADDRIIFFYSGHGDGGQGGGKPGIFMHDGNTLPYETIVKILRASKAKEKIIVINACYSGTLGNVLKSLGTNDDIIAITSSRPDEVTFEDTILGGCFFTRSLEKALMGKADKNKDKKVTLLEAFKYVHKDVVDRSTKSGNAEPQHPCLFAPKWVQDKDVVLMNWNK